ncbi:hypothetical protein [Celerinatantimonas yamalensis]|uniref:Uncharacterized protein n=1 Tax=Celerinatantimonas yamalensis TaxID=559956 RepID=A0ABW9G491_9GAMM
MSTLYQSLAIILPITCAFSFLLMMIILAKGELCAGQRSRLSQQFSTLWSLSSLGLVSAITAHKTAVIAVVILALSVLLGWCLSIKQLRLAGKRAISLKLWWLSGAPLLISALIIVATHLFSAFAALLSALALTHWLMVKANHRLKVFDKLLPLAGVGILALMVCIYALQIWQYGHQPLLAQLTRTFIHMVGFALAGLLIWLLPALRNMEPTAGQLGATSLSLIIAGISVTELQFLLH